MYSLIGVLLRTREAATRGLFIQQHVRQFIIHLCPEITHDLDLLIRNAKDQRNITYRESIARANRLMQLTTARGTHSDALLQLQQSYGIVQTVALLTLESIPLSKGVGKNTHPPLHIPAIVDLLSNIIHYILRINANSAACQRLLEACGDDARRIMYGLQAVSFCHIPEMHRQT